MAAYPTLSKEFLTPEDIATYMPSKINVSDDNVDENHTPCISIQHRTIFKLKFFTDEFHIRILGLHQAPHKELGNGIFKCFISPHASTTVDHFKDRFLKNVVLKKQSQPDFSEEAIGIFKVWEDKLRYVFHKATELYGLKLTIQLTADIDIDNAIAKRIAYQQIKAMCQYLDFKKRFASGFGISTFLIMLNWEGSLKPVQECLLRLIYHSLGIEVFDHIIFIIPSTEQQYLITSSSSSRVLSSSI